MISPSEIVLRALNRPPLSPMQADAPGRCAMCGVAHQQGDPIAPFSPDESFTDWAELGSPQSRVICGWCAGVWQRPFMDTYSKSIASSEGFFPCASNDHIAYWLLNPPEPPFVMYLSDQRIQHIVWKASPNYSKKLFTVRFGNRMLVVRPDKLKAAKASIEEIVIQVNLQSVKKIKTPFSSLARGLDDVSHGQIRATTYAEILKNPKLIEELNNLHQLTPGEVWGLTAVCYAKNPHKPDPTLF